MNMNGKSRFISKAVIPAFKVLPDMTPADILEHGFLFARKLNPKNPKEVLGYGVFCESPLDPTANVEIAEPGEWVFGMPGEATGAMSEEAFREMFTPVLPALEVLTPPDIETLSRAIAMQSGGRIDDDARLGIIKRICSTLDYLGLVVIRADDNLDEYEPPINLCVLAATFHETLEPAERIEALAAVGVVLAPDDPGFELPEIERLRLAFHKVQELELIPEFVLAIAAIKAKRPKQA